jgi:hypothetical protein
MAALLEADALDTPVLALLGSIHSFKHVEWEPRIDDAPTAAELLARHGVAVVSVLQAWPGVCEPRGPVLREPDHPEGRLAMADVFAPIAAQAPADPASAADGVVVWACRQPTAAGRLGRGRGSTGKTPRCLSSAKSGHRRGRERGCQGFCTPRSRSWARMSEFDPERTPPDGLTVGCVKNSDTCSRGAPVGLRSAKRCLSRFPFIESCRGSLPGKSGSGRHGRTLRCALGGVRKFYSWAACRAAAAAWRSIRSSAGICFPSNSSRYRQNWHDSCKEVCE